MCSLGLWLATAACGTPPPGPGTGGPGNPPRAIIVSPNTAVTDSQQVTVAGSGFPPNTLWEAAQCPTGATQRQHCANHTPVSVGTTGTFSSPFTVLYVIGQTACDTAQSCTITVGRVDSSSQGYLDAVHAPLVFASIAEPRRGSALVEPTTPRVTDSVVVTGEDWAPFAPVVVELAPAGGNGEIWKAFVSREGAFLTEFAVSSATRNGGDCTTAPGACQVSVRDERGSKTLVSVPLTVLPPPQKGHVQIDPAGPFAAGQTVRLTGSGWSPNRSMVLNVCLYAADLELCGTSDVRPRQFMTDASGSFAIDQLLPMYGSAPSHGLAVPCAGADKPYQLCHFVVADGRAYDVARVRIPLPYGP